MRTRSATLVRLLWSNGRFRFGLKRLKMSVGYIVPPARLGIRSCHRYFAQWSFCKFRINITVCALLVVWLFVTLESYLACLLEGAGAVVFWREVSMAVSSLSRI